MIIENQTPEATAASNRSSLANVLGITSGLIGSLFALAALTTPLLKIAGVLACITIAMVLWQAARDRAHGQLSTALMCQLAAAGVFLLALVILLGAETVGKPQPQKQVTASTDKPSSGSTNRSVESRSPQVAAPPPTRAGVVPTDSETAPSQPGPVWLSDISLVDGGKGWEPGEAVVDTKRFEHNVIVETCFAHSDDRASYHLGRNYQRFTASVGLAEKAPTDAKVKLTVLADSRQVFSRTVSVGTIVRLDVSVAKAYRLVMIVETIGLSSCDDRDLVLGDAELVP